MHMQAKSMNDVIVVHYNEVALKLGLRAMFVGRLLDNLRRALSDLGCGAVSSKMGRLLVEIGDADEAELLQRICVQPGVANCVPARRLAPSIEAVDAAVSEALVSWKPSGSFAVRVKRADKRFAMTSPELAAHVGAAVVSATGAPVDLRNPDSSIQIIVLEQEIYLGFERFEGCGGLPLPTGGRVLLLLSGGIDSPVAGLRMMRRGCRVDCIHFHSVPYLNDSSIDKARSLAAVLARGQGPTRLSLIPFGDAQSEVVRCVPRPLRVILYRRLMMRIASALAKRAHLSALVTGESLGQVASQTLANMSVVERAASLPVLRPLVGMDKLEISRYADREGSFEISIIPDQDCCTLFVPKHPATAAKPEEVLAAESLVEMDTLVEHALAGLEAELVPASWPPAGEARQRLV